MFFSYHVMIMNFNKTFDKDIYLLKSYETVTFNDPLTKFGVWTFQCGKFTYNDLLDRSKVKHFAWKGTINEETCHWREGNTIYFASKWCVNSRNKKYRDISRCPQPVYDFH